MRRLALSTLALFVAVIGLTAFGPPAEAQCPQCTLAPTTVYVAPMRGFRHHVTNGCSGGYGGCQGFTAAPVTTYAVTEMQGCSGGYGCTGATGCDGGRGGFLHRGPVRRFLFGN